MVRGSGSAGCYPPVKPHKPMESAHKRSGIGGELVAFPCITPMAVGLRCFRHPTNRLHTGLTKHANHAEGVQYAITSLVKGTERSSRKPRTRSARFKRASSRFFEASCFFRPCRLGDVLVSGGACALRVANPETSTEKYWAIQFSRSAFGIALAPWARKFSAARFMASRRSNISCAQDCFSCSATNRQSRKRCAPHQL